MQAQIKKSTQAEVDQFLASCKEIDFSPRDFTPKNFSAEKYIIVKPFSQRLEMVNGKEKLVPVYYGEGKMDIAKYPLIPLFVAQQEAFREEVKHGDEFEVLCYHPESFKIFLEYIDYVPFEVLNSGWYELMTNQATADDHIINYFPSIKKEADPFKNYLEPTSNNFVISRSFVRLSDFISGENKEMRMRAIAATFHCTVVENINDMDKIAHAKRLTDGPESAKIEFTTEDYERLNDYNVAKTLEGKLPVARMFTKKIFE